MTQQYKYIEKHENRNGIVEELVWQGMVLISAVFHVDDHINVCCRHTYGTLVTLGHSVSHRLEDAQNFSGRGQTPNRSR